MPTRVRRYQHVGRSIHDHPQDAWRAYQPTDRSEVPGKYAAANESDSSVLEHDPLDLSQIERARRTVAANSTNANEAAELLLMLGIYPSQPQNLGPSLAPNNLPNPQR